MEEKEIEIMTNNNNYIYFPLKKNKGIVYKKDITMISYKKTEYNNLIKDSKYDSFLISNWEPGIKLNTALKEYSDNVAIFSIEIKEIILYSKYGIKTKLELNKDTILLGVLRRDISYKYRISFILRSEKKLLILSKSDLLKLHNNLKKNKYDNGLKNILVPTKYQLKRYEDETEKFMSWT